MPLLLCGRSHVHLTRLCHLPLAPLPRDHIPVSPSCTRSHPQWCLMCWICWYSLVIQECNIHCWINYLYAFIESSFVMSILGTGEYPYFSMHGLTGGSGEWVCHAMPHCYVNTQQWGSNSRPLFLPDWNICKIYGKNWIDLKGQTNWGINSIAILRARLLKRFVKLPHTNVFSDDVVADVSHLLLAS